MATTTATIVVASVAILLLRGGSPPSQRIPASVTRRVPGARSVTGLSADGGGRQPTHTLQFRFQLRTAGEARAIVGVAITRRLNHVLSAASAALLRRRPLPWAPCAGACAGAATTKSLLPVSTAPVYLLSVFCTTLPIIFTATIIFLLVSLRLIIILVLVVRWGQALPQRLFLAAFPVALSVAWRGWWHRVRRHTRRC